MQGLSEDVFFYTNFYVFRVKNLKYLFSLLYSDMNIAMSENTVPTNKVAELFKNTTIINKIIIDLDIFFSFRFDIKYNK